MTRPLRRFSQPRIAIRFRVRELERQLRERSAALTEAMMTLRSLEMRQRAGDELLRRLSDSDIIGMATFSQSSKMLSANRALLRMIGCTSEEVAEGRLTWSDFIPPEHMARAVGALEQLKIRGSCDPFELEYIRRDGTRFWAILVAMVAEGTGIGTAFVLDMTEHRLAAEALRESRERLDMVQRSIDLGVFYCDVPIGRIFFSETCKRHHGLQPGEEVSFGSFYRLIHADDRRMVRDAIERSINERCGCDVEYRAVVSGGEGRWVRAIGKAYCSGDRAAIRFDGITVDITTQRVVANQLAAEDRRKDEFLAMLAHELRNPLASIRTATEILAMSGSRAEQPVRIREVIDRQTNHLARLVNDLLDVARVRQGKITVTAVILDLRDVVEQAVESCRSLFDSRAHQLSLTLPSEAVWVEADAGRLDQVLCNLLNNAAKYTDPGGRIGISLCRREDRAEVVVEDNGVGIAAETLPRVFELFAQGEQSLSRSEGGLGIGLTLARRIVEIHGGSIRAMSRGEGQGSRFVVELPCNVSDSQVLEPARPVGPVAEVGCVTVGQQKRVLVVEDNLDAAECLQELLEMWGHEVRTVHDGVAAVEAAAAYHPEVVLCDIGLPGMDGYQVARHIRSNADGSAAFLVAVTGYGDASDRQRSQDAGFDRHLVKPLDVDELHGLITAMIVA